MSKPNEKEIKAWLRSLPGSMSAWSKRDEIMAQAIRRLIKNSDGPEVDEGFVEKQANILSPETTMGLQNEKAIDHLWWREQRIRDMLREAGVRVREAADE